MMTNLWIFIGVLWLLATLIMWWQYLKSSRQESAVDNIRNETNVALYQEHLASLEKDLAQDTIDQENFDYLKNELDKSLLQDINTADVSAMKKNNMSVLWPIGLTVFIVVFSAGFYAKHGNYAALEQALTSTGVDPHGAASAQEQQAIERLQQLENIVVAEPENSRAWYTLAQTYVMFGVYDKAIAAYDKVIAIEGELPDFVGSKAQALYYKNEQRITPDVQQLIDKALALDPLDAATLVLLGMHGYLEQDYQAAILHWQKVVDSGRPNVNVEALNEAIAQAKELMATGSEAFNEEVGTAKMSSSAEGPQLLLNVTLSDEILSALNQGDDKVVYIYATPASGARMPLAVVKLMASDLPVQVTLDNNSAMSPQANLASSERVNLYAVVSNTGSVGIKPGDFIAEMLDVANHNDEPLTLTIATKVE